MNLLALLLLPTLVHTIAAARSEENGRSYRILAFLPIASKSHHRVWQPLLRELVTRGHHVTYVSPVPLDQPPSNFNQISLGDDREFLTKIMNRTGNDESVFMSLRGISQHFMLMRMTRKFGLAMAEITLENPEVQTLIQSDQEFDAVILESAFVQEAFIALQHRFNAVTIEIETCGNWLWGYWIHGNPLDTNYVVDTSVPYSDRMSLVEKITNTINTLITRILWQVWYMPQYQELMDKLLRYPGWRSRPSMMDMLQNTSVVLINSHLALNYPYPMSPNFKEVGGLNLVPVKPLPKALQEFMDSAENGVIYFTMGSFIQVSSTLGDKLGPIFIRVFSQLKQKVLMKWESEFPNLPSNIMISKWFPQQDVLAHKNIRMFISHGGLLSLTEAVNQGVPILGIPMIADQTKNIKHVEHYEYGLGLEFENITEASLRWAVNEIINNPKYGENAKKRSQLYRDKPETALETAVFWTEYVIRHNGAHHLKPAIATMPWYQQAMIDVYFSIALIILIPIYICFSMIKYLFRVICRKEKQTKIKRQ